MHPLVVAEVIGDGKINSLQNMANKQKKKALQICKTFSFKLFILLLTHIHIIDPLCPLVLVVLAFEEVSIKLTKTPVEAKPHNLRVTAAQNILVKIR